MIAVMDHKPWAPDDDGVWIAAFVWRGPVEEITAARLEVTPEVVLELGPPGSTKPGTSIAPRPRAKRPAKPKPVTPPAPPAGRAAASARP